MFAHVPFLTTGKICRKSPQSSVGISPKGASMDRMSRSVRSIASKAQRWVIGASSMMIALQSKMILASTVPFLMLHIGSSCLCASRGILNLECRVRPPDSSVAAIPLEAVARAISFFERIVANTVLIKNVFPVSPGASRKNTPPANKWKEP